MIDRILELALSGLWPFCGTLILSIVWGLFTVFIGGGLINGVFNAFIVPVKVRHRTKRIVAHGWPPPYLDADGDHVEPPPIAVCRVRKDEGDTDSEIH